MNLTEETIEKAVSWWAGKLIDSQPHSNGDDSINSVMACFIADAKRQDVTLDQLNVFKKALSKHIKEGATERIFNLSIVCDYGPCKMLADAANETYSGETSMKVWAHCADGTQHEAHYEIHDGTGQWFVEGQDDRFDEHGNVTHWMYYPAAPKD